ncbi:FMRFamide-related neuropeptides-like [Macrosteles quadrilineatus]|uniref:FMRFamide-related neuropeptides-like n=1 Tax=Macrosteles quadrilineatus TaxID=74068 RepID=UPI0023E0C900|nr:FMRFamide-related neuropeptides-like [Macrosteles quadrilineatus]
MRSWTVVICLVVTQLAELGCGKRFDPAMVDPLMRRSSLDKNFMRFGRSSPSYEEKVTDDSPGDAKEDFLRPMRGKDNNFMRFGRGKGDNFMRFGRGKQDSFMRFGRARNDNYMRFGRARDNNFMRFGRARDNNFMRFGRGKEDNYMRFGRGKSDNFMRFGKGVNYGKQDSSMRLGRGKQDSFMRFGRDFILDNPKELESNADEARVVRGKQNNLMRFGKKFDEDSKNDLLEVPVNPKQTIRIVRGKQDSFMRFGKSDNENVHDEEDFKDANESVNNLLTLEEPKDVKPNFDLVGVNSHTLSNPFIRFGRSSPDENVQELIPQRLKRSVSYEEEQEDRAVPFVLPDDLEEEYVSPIRQEDYNSRKKRSLVHHTTESPDLDDSVVDYISAKLRLRSSAPEYESSLLSAGLPNVIVGPEFSLLPNLDPSASMMKRSRPGDKSFLRLG